MKICAIGLRGIPNIMGGIESHCQQLYPRLVRSGQEVTVIARAPYVKTKPYVYQGVKVVPVWTIRNKFLEAVLHTFVALLYARFWVHPDVVHIHGIGPALMTPVAKMLGMKVMVTHHGTDYDRQKWNAFAKSVLEAGERMALRFADRIIVVGKSLTHTLKRANPSNSAKIQFIPNGALTGFDESIDQGCLPEDLPIVAERYILSVARIVPEKGLHDLIKAFERSVTDLKLVIVGKADHEDDYSRNLLKLKSDRVLFAGRRGGTELAALYKYARVFVLPSYHEGLPIVALEAISAGTSVILSDIEANLDVGLPKDCYFETGNIYALTEKLNALSSLDLKVSRDVFLDKFNWDKISEKTNSVYMELLV